ncbi:MAG TPA: arginine--tRNA ligase, partial [Candidatus Thioglobus sp.]|nr:arginine--tRNA ligase [Candidatus Thioglobus sp.]
MKEQLQTLLKQSLEALVSENILSEVPKSIRLDHSKDKTHGDFASNIALVLSKQAKCSPQKLAQQIIDHLPNSGEIVKTEIAGPGFINFFMSQDSNTAVLDQILEQAVDYGCSDIGKGQSVLLEFVSANPTGPLHVGHGRGAAYGATVANLLRAVGFKVDSEYYVNDAGRQMDILA